MTGNLSVVLVLQILLKSLGLTKSIYLRLQCVDFLVRRSCGLRNVYCQFGFSDVVIRDRDVDVILSCPVRLVDLNGDALLGDRGT